VRFRCAGIAAIATVLGGVPGCAPESGVPTRGNALLVSIDTLRADHLGSYGYGRDTSPFLDGLAESGVRFDAAFSTSSWTLPAHGSLLTSKPPHRHGAEHAGARLRSSVPTLAEVLRGAGYRTAAVVSWFYVSRRYGFDRGFEQFEERLPEVESLAGSARAAEVVDAAMRWLDGAEEPFFLFVHIFDPHLHYDPPEPYSSMFDPGYEGSIDGRLETLRPYIAGRGSAPKTLGELDRAHVVALYDGEIRYVDAQLERLFSGLEADVAARTLAIVTSDHGEEFGEHGSMEGHQWTLYDEVIRVPLLLRGPGVEPGVVDALASTLDIAPTLLDLLGVEAPDSFEGRSLRPLLAGGAPTRELVFAETRRMNRRFALRDLRRKLVYTRPGRTPFGFPIQGGFELYDLDSDPGEQRNLWPEEQLTACPLVADLEAFMSRSRSDATGTPPDRVEFSQDERERLRALGYLE
jgi:arylsulfatase A-like enzyme